MKKGIGINLNREQLEAVSTLKGPVVIVAGPGTGKTQLLSERAANIMKIEKTGAESILILTYTSAAAKSVKDRLVKMVGFEGYRIMADTFHGFANSVILSSEEASEYIKERVQITDLERIKCIEYIIDSSSKFIKELRPFGAPYYYTSDISKKISELKNEGITPEEFEKLSLDISPDGSYITEKHIPRLRELSYIYKRYEELKTGCDKKIFDERGRYDYDDMILIAEKVISSEPTLREEYRSRYKFIMVDEFQDTNGAQLKLLLELCGKGNPNMCVVGDDDQSIYRFQGASIENFRIFKKIFPKAKTVRLKDNYRSSKEIIDLYEAIITQVPERERLDKMKKLIAKKSYNKTNMEFTEFSTEEEELLYIVDKIKSIKKDIENSKDLSSEEKKVPYNQMAVLVRKRASILKLIDCFLRYGIPYATDGKEDISCQKRVRQMLKVLELARPEPESEEEKDRVLYEVLSSDFFRIPQKDIVALIAFLNRRKNDFPTFLCGFLRIFDAENFSQKPTISDTKKLKSHNGLKLDNPNRLHAASWVISRLRKDSGTRPLHDILMGFIEDVAMYKFVLEEYGHNNILITRELRALTSFINMVKNSALSRTELTLGEFLSDVDTRRSHKMSMQGQLVTATQDGVRIITAHASKGLEFHTCFIPFCLEKRNWPLKSMADRIPIPPSIIKTKEAVKSKTELENLAFFDEVRLFYVAASRAKANLIFTASPSEKAQSSSFLNNSMLSPGKANKKENEILKEYLKTNPEINTVKGTEKILKDLAKNVVLTPTKVNNFLKCGRKFLYDNLLLLPGSKNQSLVFGNCTHKALEETYGTYKKTGKFPNFDFFKSAFLQELKFQGANKRIRGWCTDKLSDLKKWFEITAKNPIMPIDLEKKKIVTLKDGVMFTGKYDKVEFEDETSGLIRIIDYKTGKPDDHIKNISRKCSLESEECDDYMRQLVAYKLLYEKDIHEPVKYKVSSGVLVFLEPVKADSNKYSLTKGQYIDKKVTITDSMANELEELVCKVWRRINNIEFDKLPEKDQKKCTFCPFSSMCWEE